MKRGKLNRELIRNIKRDLELYPCYKLVNGQLVRIPTPPQWQWVHLHHFIRTKWIEKNPDKWEQVKHLQKLIYLEPVIHMELHNKHSKFKEKYGIEIKELLFDWREYMLDAKIARKQSNENDIKNRQEHIEKLISKAIKEGKTYAFVTGEVADRILDELEKHGYSYDKQPTGYKIMW